MTDTFEDLKLLPELVAGAESLGWDAPAGLQRDAVAVIRRGNNVVLHASAGSGVVGAYGLGILDRLARTDLPAGAPGALVLVADSLAASAVADSLARLADLTPLSVRALGPGWDPEGAHVLVAATDDALAAVRSSTLKLDAVDAVVIDGVDVLVDSGLRAGLETLADAVPGDAQRVVVTGRFDNDIDAFIEGHARKAMTVPPKSEPGELGDNATVVGYAVAPENGKPAAAAHLLAGLGDSVAVVCRTVDGAAGAEVTLAARGAIGGEAEVVVLPRTEADTRSVQARVLSFDVPFDADEMAELHHNGGAVLSTPRELPHLKRTAARAGLRLEAVTLPTAGSQAPNSLRARLRDLVTGDLTPELALLDPLLSEFPAAELAAAALRLAREAGERGQAHAPSATATGAGEGVASRTGPGVPAGKAPPPDRDTWTHLFLSIGERDGVGPGDIVGAITGEAGVDGDQVGKIDIRESHTTVEVATGVAGRVIDALNGRTLKGRSMRVDYDRKGRSSSGSGPSGGRRRGGPGGSSPRGRGGSRRPRS